MNSPLNALPLPEIYYHYPTQDYWMPDDRGRWIRVTETSVKRYLKDGGFSDQGGGGLSEIDRALLTIQKSQNVSYAAKLAGHNAGCHDFNGNRLLVTESPKLIVPKAGEWPLIDRILDGMLNVEPVDQRPYLFGWLKMSLQSLYSRKWTQAQVLAFAGPPNSAKSLMQSLITEMFGGRSAKPFLFMSGKTDFNADLFQAEHLVVEDECESSDFRTRRHFAGQIKQIAVNKKQHCHGKNKDGLDLPPLWRSTISLNDDPERLMVLPSIHDDIEDKIMLFKVAQQSMPMPTETADEKELFWQALIGELPAFVDAMLKHQIPEELKCNRYGITHYHHPDLLQALTDTSPEIKLLELIDENLFEKDRLGGSLNRVLDLSAQEIEQGLSTHSEIVDRKVRQLLPHSNSAGILLGRLTKSFPERFSKREVNGRTRWTIQPPQWDTNRVCLTE